MLEWLRSAAIRARSGLLSGRLRLFSRGEPVLPIPLDLLPTEDDRSLEAWFLRLEERVADAALVVNGVQALSGEAWRRALAWMTEIVDERTGGGSLELFIGRYRRGPFGVHKDDQDVFTFVVSGKKRFRLWPFEELAARFGVPPSARDAVHVLPGLGALNLPDELRATSIVLEGEPGDVMYWPASAWHVAENASTEANGGPLTVTLGLGRFRQLGPAPLLAKVVARAVHEGAPSLALPTSGDLSEGAQALWTDVLAWLGSDAVRAIMTEELVAWASALRFPLAPPLAAPSRDEAVEAIAPAVPGTIAWARQGDHLVWSSGGHLARYPYHPGIERILARIDRGAPLDASAAMALLEGADEQPVEPAVARAVLRAVMARNSAVSIPGPRGDEDHQG